MPVARSGIAALEKMLAVHAGERVIAIEATGSLHRAWAAELERLYPGSLRLFAPSETKAARTPPTRSSRTSATPNGRGRSGAPILTLDWPRES